MGRGHTGGLQNIHFQVPGHCCKIPWCAPSQSLRALASHFQGCQCAHPVEDGPGLYTAAKGLTHYPLPLQAPLPATQWASEVPLSACPIANSSSYNLLLTHSVCDLGENEKTHITGEKVNETYP